MSGNGYVIGCDFGTLSMRTVLVDASDGRIAACETYEYTNAVITDKLPESGVKLNGTGWALQDPDDYLRALEICIPSVLKQSGVSPENIKGIGVDFTISTVVPIDENGNALCRLPEFRNRPHAWVKLWKNHTAFAEADLITEHVRKHKLNALDNYGFKASSEWFFPKIWEILRKDKEIYDRAYTFMEGGDFIVYKLCGNIVRSGVLAAAKGFYDNEKQCFPDKSFFKGLDPLFENVVEEKHLEGVKQVGSVAGGLTAEMAAKLGLKEGTTICVSHADAAVALLGGGVTDTGIITFIMGTSTCHIMLSDTMKQIPGMCATYYEGVLPGYYCYEAGQNAVGDIFDWFCRNYVPQSYYDEAEARDVRLMQLMDEKAGNLKIGQSGIVALDWMNGNRSVLQDANLTGALIGLTLHTKPEEIYRALIEATAFGTKVIMEQFAKNDIPVKEVYACGGLAHKSPILMQMYSDIIGMPIKVTGDAQTSALASSIFAAVAANLHKSYKDAVAKMSPPPKCEYRPIAGNTTKYNGLFEVYQQLHDYFGLDTESPMKKLRDLQHSAM